MNPVQNQANPCLLNKTRMFQRREDEVGPGSNPRFVQYSTSLMLLGEASARYTMNLAGYCLKQLSHSKREIQRTIIMVRPKLLIIHDES